MTSAADSGQCSRGLTGARVILVIDELSHGGAQRQLVMLARGLKGLGYGVEVLVYHRNDFYASDFAEAGIPVGFVPFRNKAHLVRTMRKAIKTSGPDAVIAGMEGPNMLIELAGLPRRSFAFVAREATLDITGPSLRRALRYRFHLLADAVVSNSHAQYRRMLELAPRLRDRTRIIVNGVDLEKFTPGSPPPSRPGELRMLVLARFHPQKNPLGLMEAVEIVRREQPRLDVQVDWHGDQWKREGYYAQLEEAIARKSLGGTFRLRPAAKDVERLYHGSDVVCLPSLFEGTANVICEAMACGIPLLVGRVSDNPRLVEEGRNGLLFEPSSARDMADTILRFAAIPHEARRKMGLAGRRMAEEMFSPDAMVDNYARLIEEVIDERRGPSRQGRVGRALGLRPSAGVR